MTMELINGDKYFNKKPVKSKKSLSVIILIETKKKKKLIKFSSIKRLTEYIEKEYSVKINRKKISKLVQTKEIVKDGNNKVCYVIALYNEENVKKLKDLEGSKHTPSSKIKFSKSLSQKNEDYLVVVPKLTQPNYEPFMIHSFVVGWVFKIALIDLFKQLRHYKRIELDDCYITTQDSVSNMKDTYPTGVLYELRTFLELREIARKDPERVLSGKYKLPYIFSISYYR